MPNMMKNSDSALSNSIKAFTFTDAAAYYINKSNISSISELMSFLSEQNNVVKLPYEIINEYLEIIEDIDPVFVASFKSVNSNSSTSNKPSSNKTFLSVLSLEEHLLQKLESIGIQYVEDVIENFDGIKHVFSLKQLWS